MMRIVREARELRAACDELRAQGEVIGLVPTMGALHAGHLSLVEAARETGATRVALSIFVNPTQFGAGEDFDSYPRTFQEDLALCESRGVDLVYAPDPDSMYPPGFQSHVEVEKLTQRLEGRHRPTHFRGVTTVVTKLFNAVGACVATFGQKDYQQWRVIARMARDLDMPVTVVGCPIVREADGLAMSSRNRYLTPDQRARAIGLQRGLREAQTAYEAGERSRTQLEAIARRPVAETFDEIDYVTLADAEDLSELGEQVDGSAVMLMAARIGPTRLIDNMVLAS